MGGDDVAYKIYDSGRIRDMTEDEASRLVQAAQEQPEQPQPVETQAVTFEALAQAIREGVNSVE